MKQKSKRGQAAAGAAVLLAIVAGLLILFIILIPPQDRAELLDESSTADDSSTSTSEINEAVIDRNLLQESPGRVDYLAQKEMEHNLPVINIFTKTEDKIIAEKNIAHLEKGIFAEEQSKFKFNIEDLKNTNNLLLTFNVDSAEGNLIIQLNGEEIYNYEANSGNIQPIVLSKNNLEASNEIIFSASSPGIAFWASNEITLEDIKIIGEITSIDAQSSKNIFTVSETEKNNIDKVELRFKPECKFEEVGKLSISLNGEEIYDGIPDCDLSLVKIEISPEYIHYGENEIIFATSKGSYILSYVLIQSQLKELDYPTYYFELSQEEYDQIMDNDRRVRLEMNFVDVIDSKYGEIVFNGHRKYFDTKEVEFVLDLSEDVVKGHNSVKIKPKKTLDIRQIKVDLVK